MEMYKYFNINDDYYRVLYRRHPQSVNRLEYYKAAQYTAHHNTLTIPTL